MARKSQRTSIKTVKFGGYTATYDVATHTYLIDGLPMLDRFASIVYARAWFESANTDSVVVVSDDKDRRRRCNEQRNIAQNSERLLGRTHGTALGWEENAVATSAFFEENYEAFVPAFYQNGPGNLFYGHSANGQPWFWNGVNTGATWTDMEDYITLLVVAYAQPSQSFAYGLVHGKGYVGEATIVRTQQGVIVSAGLEEAAFPLTLLLKLQLLTLQQLIQLHPATVVKLQSTSTQQLSSVETHSLTAQPNTTTLWRHNIEAWLEDEANAMVYFLSVPTIRLQL